MKTDDGVPFMEKIITNSLKSTLCLNFNRQEEKQNVSTFTVSKPIAVFFSFSTNHTTTEVENLFIFCCNGVETS